MVLKDLGCGGMVIGWIAVFILSWLNKTDTALANLIWQLPIGFAFLAAAGAAFHWIAGMGDYDPTRNQEFMRIRQGSSAKQLGGLVMAIAGLGISVAGMHTLGGIFAAAGIVTFLVTFIDGLHTDRWTYEEQATFAAKEQAWLREEE